MKGRNYYYNTKLTHEEINKNSEMDFRKVIKYAYKHSSFYRKYYEENGIAYEDLRDIPIEKIPTINKDMVRENFYEIATKNVSKVMVNKALESGELIAKVNKYNLVHTSGSTGTPCNFLYDRRAINIIESNFIRLSIGGKHEIGIKDFPIKSVYVAPVGNGYACTALAMKGLKEYHVKGIVLDASTPKEKWGEIINNYSPGYLSGYPSCLNMIAKLQEEGVIDFHPKKIITGGEPLNHENAVYLSNIFNADIIDYYGCTESILLGAGSSFYEGIYLFDDLNYFEVDCSNHLIITPLYNKLFPLIRYKLNDMVEGFSKEYKGVLPFTHINRVMGRNEEIMWFLNEKGEEDFLHPLFIDDLNVKGVNRYQFEQIDKESFILKCINTSSSTNEIRINIEKQIDRFLSRKNLSNVKYKIIFLDDLPVNPLTGKIKLVIKRNNL